MYGKVSKQIPVTWLHQVLGREVKVIDLQPVGGGSINEAYKLNTTAGTFFLKKNRAPIAATMFATEARGLALLSGHSEFTVPRVIGRYDDGANAYLLLEYINSAARAPGYWRQLGLKLAGLHRHTATSFGLDHDNYIGSLPQPNRQATDWPTFFAGQRIEPLLQMAFDRHLIDRTFKQTVASLLPRLAALMPVEPPALLHGDLWSGNLMVDESGSPCLVDPAVYYGHREMDIAFSHLFGGFSDEFYQVYQEELPMVPGFAERLDLYNLYPLFVHLILFGTGYLGQIKAIIHRFA